MLLLCELALEVPTVFTAAIEKVYAVLEAKEPVTVKGLDEPETLKAIEGELVTV
jgi:hypothetical protein